MQFGRMLDFISAITKTKAFKGITAHKSHYKRTHTQADLKLLKDCEGKVNSVSILENCSFNASV